jgi:hypothetical protein
MIFPRQSLTFLHEAAARGAVFALRKPPFSPGGVVFPDTLACLAFLLDTIYLLLCNKMAGFPDMPCEARCCSYPFFLAELRVNPSQLLPGHLDHDQINYLILLDHPGWFSRNCAISNTFVIPGSKWPTK